MEDKRTYSKWMPDVYEYYCDNFDSTKCSECGGTGIVPQGCCDGRECGCMGMPVDFDVICAKCKKEAPKSI